MFLGFLKLLVVIGRNPSPDTRRVEIEYYEALIMSAVGQSVSPPFTGFQMKANHRGKLKP